MQAKERAAIEQLFQRLDEAERSAAAPDAAAEALIKERLAAQPQAAYRMAQTILALEQALAAAESRAGAPMTAAPAAPAAARNNGSFLGGAAETALAVAGGFLLADLISGGIGGIAGAAPGAEAGRETDAAAAAEGGDEFDLGGMLDIFN